MKEESHLAKYFQTDDSILLKDAAETLRDKLEIIGHNLINQKKFKKTAGHQIYQLEEQVKKFIKKEEFRREHEDTETRIKEFVMAQLGHVQKDLAQHKEELTTAVKFYEEAMKETKEKTLWKITDVEKIIESRISEKKVTEMIEALDQKFTLDLKICDDKLQDKFTAVVNDISSKVESAHVFAEARYKDLIANVNLFSEKIQNTVSNDEFVK